MTTCTHFPFLFLNPRFVYLTVSFFFVLLVLSFFPDLGKAVWLATIFASGMLCQWRHVAVPLVIQLNVRSQAYYVFWAEIGRRMGMRDIPESLEDMKAWSAVCIPTLIITVSILTCLIGVRGKPHASRSVKQSHGRMYDGGPAQRPSSVLRSREFLRTTCHLPYGRPCQNCDDVCFCSIFLS
jgi:hypothetical protein